jgi:predicted Zn-dependent protease
MAELNIMEAMLGEGEDNALIRFTMGSAFIKHGKYEQAIEQLAKAVELKPDYTTAWLKYAQALIETGRTEESISTLEIGISVATEKNDTQSLAEMQNLLNSLQI